MTELPSYALAAVGRAATAFWSIAVVSASQRASWLRLLIALTLVQACGTARATDPQIRARARQFVLSGASCPEKQIVHEDSETLVFVLSGCGRVVRIHLVCDENECINENLTASKFRQPQVLLTADGKFWHAPGLPPHPPKRRPPPSEGEGKVIKPGKRLSDVRDAPFRPDLPRELNHAGIVVWGLFMVCVDTTGVVTSVEVQKSTLPGGMDGHWVSYMELWKYQPYEIDGRAASFCSPVRLQVQAAL